MLYDAYEVQKSMFAGASAMANFGAGVLQNPSNPFAYFGGGPILASALEVFAHAAAPRGKPEFGSTIPSSTGAKWRWLNRWRCACPLAS